MKKLIKMYNEKYGDTLGVIDDDFNKEQMYRIYYFIKNNCDDKDIQDRIKMIHLDKPKTLEQQLTKLEGENGNINVKKYIDDNTVIHPLPVYEISESPSTITYIVNIMDLKKLTTYGAIRDINSTKYQRYRFVYICDDGKKKTIVNTSDTINDTTFRVYHYGTSSTLTFNNKIYSINYTNHSTSTDVVVTESIQNYLGIYNTQEYTPTENYHPATKKYVDDKIKNDLGDEELTTTNKNVKGAINEVNAQYKDIAYFVTPEMYGCVGDGITDDTINLQNAINDSISKNLTLVAKNKTYKVTNTININGKIHLNFNNSTIKAGTSLNQLLKINNDFTDNYISDLVLDGDNLVDDCLYISFAKRSSFSKIIIKNFIKTGLRIDSPTYNLRFNVIRIYNDSERTNFSNIGIKVDTNDIEFTDVYINNCKTAVWSSGNNRFLNIHPSLLDSSIISGSKCFDLSGSTFVCNAVIDTFETCFNITELASINLVNISIVNNKDYYVQTTPFTILNYNQKNYAKRTHIYGLACNNTLSQLSSNPLFTNLTGDNIFDFEVEKFTTLNYSTGCYPISNIPKITNSIVDTITPKTDNISIESCKVVIKDKRVNINATLKVTTSTNGLTEVALLPLSAVPSTITYLVAYQGTSASNCSIINPTIIYTNRILTIRILDCTKGEYFVVNCCYDID